MAHAHGAHRTSMGIDSRKMAFWAFIGSECLLFGSLISTYLIYKGKSLVGPYPHDVLNIPFTSFSTFDLLMSSLAMVLALAAIQRGDMKQGKLWLFVTALLGLVFLGGQFYEFSSFVHEGAEFVELAAQEDEAEQCGDEQPQLALLHVAALNRGQRQHHRQARHQEIERAERGKRNIEHVVRIGADETLPFVDQVGRDQRAEQQALGADERPERHLPVVQAHAGVVRLTHLRPQRARTP